MKKVFVTLSVLYIASGYAMVKPLKELDYSDGKFNEQELVQQSDEYLAEIGELNLSSNSLTHFPAVLQRMPNLQNLFLNKNQIGSFKDMPVLPSLQSLGLNENKIDSFKHMPVLTNLQILWLQKNQIGSFEDMPILTNLQQLHLSNNQIGSFKHMPVLTNLQLLGLNNNKIDSTAINTWKQKHPNIHV